MACKREGGGREGANFKGSSLKLLIKVEGVLRPRKLGIPQQVSIWEPRGGGSSGCASRLDLLNTMPSRCASSGLPFSISFRTGSDAPARSRPSTPGPQVRSTRIADRRAQQLCPRLKHGSYTTSAIRETPPAWTLPQGGLPSSSPVSPSAFAGRRTLEE